MSDDLNEVIREICAGLRPGERVIDGERFYSAAYLDDRRLRAVPDKEQQMDEQTQTEDPQYFDAIRPALDAYLEAAAEMPETGMPLSDALATLAETVDGAGRIYANVHELPLQFFARPDMGPLTTLKSGDELFFTAPLEIGGHEFQCFSRGFPLEAE